MIDGFKKFNHPKKKLHIVGPETNDKFFFRDLIKKNNNDVDNLAPLCQNHHQLTRMNEYKDDINKQIKACV